MTVRSEEDLEGLKRIGKLVAQARELMAEAVKPGVTTRQIDDVGAKFLREHGAVSSPQKVYNFPGFSCISVNHEIVHGIPSERVIKAGDAVKLDVTAELNGYVADSATTVLVPPVKVRARKLVACARAAFQKAMEQARPGRLVSEIGRAVEHETNARGFAVVRELCGHGVGRNIHEAPEVLNYYEPREKFVLHEGLVIAVEPILSASQTYAAESGDGWTYLTGNHSLAVHYEHTIMITKGEPLVITA